MKNEATSWKIAAVNAKGQEFLALIESLRTPSTPFPVATGRISSDYCEQAMVVGTFDRELTIAAERVDEAVMWALKHITG